MKSLKDIKEMLSKSGSLILGTKKEVKELTNIINDDEIITYATSGVYDGHTWLVVSTNKRIIFLDKGMLFGVNQIEIPLSKVNAVKYKKGLFVGEIEIWDGASMFRVKSVLKKTLIPFINAVNNSIEEMKKTQNYPKLSVADEIMKFKRLLGAQGVSDTCSFAPNPDTFLERVIKKIQSEKRTNDIFCDRDKVKMAYYTIEDEDYNANVGVAIKVAPTTTNDDFKKEFYKKFNDYKDFFTKIDTKNLGKTPLPDKEIVRFYVQFPDEKSIIIIGKYEYNLKTKERQLVANLKAKDYFEKLNLFQPLAVKVTYSDDGHIF